MCNKTELEFVTPPPLLRFSWLPPELLQILRFLHRPTFSNLESKGGPPDFNHTFSTTTFTIGKRNLFMVFTPILSKNILNTYGMLTEMNSKNLTNLQQQLCLTFSQHFHAKPKKEKWWQVVGYPSGYYSCCISQHSCKKVWQEIWNTPAFHSCPAEIQLLSKVIFAVEVSNERDYTAWFLNRKVGRESKFIWENLLTNWYLIQRS